MMIGATSSSRYQRLAGDEQDAGQQARAPADPVRHDGFLESGYFLPIFDLNSAQMSTRSLFVETSFALSSMPESKIAWGTKIVGSSRISWRHELLRLVVRRGVGVRHRLLGLDRRLLDEVEERVGGDRVGRILEDDPGIHPVQRPVRRDDVLRVGRLRILDQLVEAAGPGQAEDGLLGLELDFWYWSESRARTCGARPSSRSRALASSVGSTELRL